MRQSKYSEEIQQRRRQQQEDEEYARRLQYAPDDDEYLGDYEETAGPGKSGGQSRNENYRRRSQSLVQPTPPPAVLPAVPPAPPAPPMPPTPFNRTPPPVADYVSGVNRARGVRGTSIDRLADRFSEQRHTNSPVHRSYGSSITHGASTSLAIGAPPPAPTAPTAMLMRHHTMDDEIFSNPRGIRMSSERMMTPRRATQHEYLLEDMDFHALSPPPSSSGSRRRGYQRGYLPQQQQQQQQQEEHPPDSVLAGLQGPGRGANRVFEWSKHVEPGMPDNASIVT